MEPVTNAGMQGGRKDRPARQPLPVLQQAVLAVLGLSVAGWAGWWIFDRIATATERPDLVVALVTIVQTKGRQLPSKNLSGAAYLQPPEAGAVVEGIQTAFASLDRIEGASTPWANFAKNVSGNAPSGAWLQAARSLPDKAMLVRTGRGSLRLVFAVETPGAAGDLFDRLCYAANGATPSNSRTNRGQWYVWEKAGVSLQVCGTAVEIEQCVRWREFYGQEEFR